MTGREGRDELRERLAHAFRSAEESARVLHALPLAVAVVDLDGRLLTGNAALEDLLGVPVSELADRHFSELTHEDDRSLDEDATRLLVAGEPAPTIEKRYRHRSGELVWTEVAAGLATDASGRPVYAVAAIRDIGQRRAEHERLRWLALHDPLTGAANRVLLDDRLTQALHALDREGGVVAVYYVDVDGFKAVNDQHGHDVGDQVLHDVVRRASAAVRSRDTVARMGGDEFVVVAHVRSVEEVRRLGTRLRDDLHTEVVVGDTRVPLTVTVGISFTDDPATTGTDMLRSADQDLVAAKRARPGASPEG